MKKSKQKRKKMTLKLDVTTKTITKLLDGMQEQIDELKSQKCECSNSSIIDPNRPKEADSPMIDFGDAVAFHYANLIAKPVVDYIKTNPDKFKSGLVESKRETIQFNGEPLEVTEMQKLVLRDHFMLPYTNTKKDDKNPVEVEQVAKKGVYIGEEFSG